MDPRRRQIDARCEVIWRGFRAELVGRRRDGALIVLLAGKAAATVGTRFRLPAWDLTGSVDAAEHELSPHGFERTRIALGASYTTASLFIPGMPLELELELPAIAPSTPSTKLAAGIYRTTGEWQAQLSMTPAEVRRLASMGIGQGTTVIARGEGIEAHVRLGHADAGTFEIRAVPGLENNTYVEIHRT